MLRFLTQRILAAIPVLFLLSVVTFAIIHSRPGDYGDYVYSMLTAFPPPRRNAWRMRHAPSMD
jgi:ABC-type dipeptide/oligopeptide/nickel transport system permease component